MSPTFVQVLLGLDRVVALTGLVLIAGSLAAPRRPDTPRVGVVWVGVALMVAAALATPLVRWSADDRSLGDVLSGQDVTAALARLAVLAGVAFFVVDLPPGRAAPPIVVLLSATLVLELHPPSDAIAWLAAVAGTAHVGMLAAWLGRSVVSPQHRRGVPTVWVATTAVTGAAWAVLGLGVPDSVDPAVVTWVVVEIASLAALLASTRRTGSALAIPGLAALAIVSASALATIAVPA